MRIRSAFSPRFLQFISFATIALCVSALPHGADGKKVGSQVEAPPRETDAKAGFSADSMGLFQRIFNLVLRDYVDSKMPESVVPGALQGCAEASGAESAYIPPTEVKTYLELAKPGASLPMYLTKGEDFARIISCYPGLEKAPAPGDMLKSVNGRSTYDLTYPQVLALARGTSGQKVECVFLKHDAFETYPLNMSFSDLPKPSLLELPQGVVLALPSLGSELEDRLVASLKGAKYGVLIDLRGCAQADNDAALKTAGLLLGKREGPPSLSQKGEIKHPIDGRGYISDKKIRVMVNSSTARGGEVLASALARAGATVVGEQTMGWAPEASDLPLKNGGLLRINTAFFLAPDGKPINNHPIEPTIKLSKEEGEADAEYYRRALTVAVPKSESQGLSSASFQAQADEADGGFYPMTPRLKGYAA